MSFSTCLEVSSGLIDIWTLWGALGPSFAPVLVVVIGLDLELGPDLLPDVVDASKYAPSVSYTPWPWLSTRVPPGGHP